MIALLPNRYFIHYLIILCLHLYQSILIIVSTIFLLQVFLIVNLNCIFLFIIFIIIILKLSNCSLDLTKGTLANGLSQHQKSINHLLSILLCYFNKVCPLKHFLICIISLGIFGVLQGVVQVLLRFIFQFNWAFARLGNVHCVMSLLFGRLSRFFINERYLRFAFGRRRFGIGRLLRRV